MNAKRFHMLLTVFAMLSLLAIMHQPTQASGATIYVPDNYPTIQGALNAANLGDTVYVRAGTYYEHLVVSKSLTLQGEGKATTIIDGGGSGYGIYLPSTDNATISGFTVRNCRSAVFFQSGASYNLVKDTVVANSEYGFDNGDTGNNHNTFQNVEAYGITQLGLSAYAGSNYTTVIDSYFHDNYMGIGMGWSSNWSVSGTTLTNNTYGLGIDAADYGIVRNNIITNNSLYGIILNGPHEYYNLITGNKISGNDSGIQFRCAGRFNTVTENEISDNSAYGVFLLRNDACPNYGNTFYHNTFSNNTVNAQDDEERYGGNTWDNGYPSGGNIWDNYTGVDLFSGSAQDVLGADGIGDTPYVIRVGLDVDRYPMMQPDTNPPSCPSSMISYWPFNESNGQIANDMVDGRLLTLGTSSGIDSQDPVWTTGSIEGALMFDGVNDLARGGSLPQMSEGTIEAWVNRTAYGNYPNPIVFGLFRPGTYTGAIFILQADSNLFGTKIFEWVKMDSNNKQIRLATPDNAWEYNHSYHIVATWGPSGMKFYINGVLADSTIYDGEVETDNPATDFIGSTAPIEIGDYIAYGHAGWQPFAGTIDEVAVYNTALTPAEVQAHYQNGLNGYSYCEQPPTDATPPTIVPTVSGTQGNNGWYTSDVTISWEVSDPESGIASSVGCDLTTLATDTAGDTLACSATNGASLSNSDSVTVKIDKTPPTVVASATTDPNPSGWYKVDVTVRFTCNDALSGIPADACPLDQILSAEGAAVASTAQTVADAAGNTSPDSNVVTVNIDKTAPAITWNSSINDGDSFYFGFVPPTPTCTALDSLSGVDGSCLVSGYATTVGPHILTATAKDNASNQSTKIRNYTVLAWTLKGFYQPVDMNGIFNIAKNGSTVPLKFKVFAGATELTDIAYIKSLAIGLTACYADAPSDAIEMTATGGTSLRYDPIAGQFIYNWKTPNTAGKCYRVTMTALDGSALVAYFKLK